MKGPISHEGYEQRYKYQEFVKQYLTEQNIPLKPWEAVRPLYLRYRARCLKLQPETYEQFLNLCTFKSSRKTKYDIKGELKEDAQVGWEKKDKKEATGSRDVICRLRKEYKLNYKAPPKKEDFELDVDYRLAYKDWSYLKYALADYEAVKSLIEEFENGQHTAAVGDNNHDLLLNYPWLIKYALRCLSGVYPAECFPEVLNDYKEELQELLNKQREAYSKSESETILNDLTKYALGGIKYDKRAKAICRNPAERIEKSIRETHRGFEKDES